ncbi:cytochrome c oxidase subunit 3 [Aquimarina sp. ERC-38]|uniref:cytochrome c oxidase subunit 3 n=1 Tax=Aquimarina sp. ERC-38 TaxID=2949996 RepID=UPI0022460465|nr:cytochrome c oxidase subunit 3 [Aquimarina sp. ERC-38]UZO81202.1 cytochrome c oxidase subunit 3 [Aquimarina sp. ERC-38]
MDLTEGTRNEKVARSKKTMMWFAMISMTMTFAGLTSAYVVSKSREDWAVDLQFPNAFITSLFIILLSSATLYAAKFFIQKENQKLATLLIIGTFLLAINFVVLQFIGFEDMMGQGYHFTGPTSNIVSTFMFIIIATHLVHVAGGLIVLTVVLINQFRNKYQKNNMLGLEIGSMYWHFVDVLWIYLFLFLFFIR